MSQAKVDRYKLEKANRKKNVKKQKRNKFFKYFLGVLGCVAIVAVIILSAKVLKGDFDEEPTATYSAAQIESLRNALGVNDKETEDGETSHVHSDDEDKADSKDEEATTTSKDKADKATEETTKKK